MVGPRPKAACLRPPLWNPQTADHQNHSTEEIDHGRANPAAASSSPDEDRKFHRKRCRDAIDRCVHSRTPHTLAGRLGRMPQSTIDSMPQHGKRAFNPAGPNEGVTSSWPAGLQRSVCRSTRSSQCCSTYSGGPPLSRRDRPRQSYRPCRWRPTGKPGHSACTRCNDRDRCRKGLQDG